MARGTPVISGSLSSLPEVAGRAALLVDPYDTAAIRDAMLILETDASLRMSLVEAGYAQARRFSWERAAKQLKSIYDGMLSA